jgi:hypothetical protein
MSAIIHNGKLVWGQLSGIRKLEKSQGLCGYLGLNARKVTKNVLDSSCIWLRETVWSADTGRVQARSQKMCSFAHAGVS